MSISVLKAGMQTTVQASPRVGFRHLGIPAAGPADPLSMALANRLVGNALLTAAVEVTYTGPTLAFERPATVALTGGTATASVNGGTVEFHRTLRLDAGDELQIGPVESGARVYVAVAGGIAVPKVLGSASTYLPAALGGIDGRALRDADVLNLANPDARTRDIETPNEFRPPVTSRWMLRACRGAETALLAAGQLGALFDTSWTVGRRADRMGMQLEGDTLSVRSGGRLPSAAVFPGTLQCPEDGRPFLLCIDAQTIGGYPRIANVARADRHLLGQMRPGDSLQLLPRQPAEAVTELRAKHDYWRKWLPGIETVI